MKQPAVSLACLMAAVAILSAPLEAQPAAPSTQRITVDGKAMRVLTSGLEARKPGQPVIVLESGAGGGADHWKPIFTQIATLAPVFAYDRRGVGQSDFDSTPQTLDQVATTLHHLLQEARVPPPYVLVGASWGGAFTRKFGTLFPSEVAGFVHLDVTDIDATRAELSLLPPGVLVEIRSIVGAVKDEFRELRTLRPPVNVVASKARHFLFNDDPALVLHAIEYAVNNARK